MDNLFFALTLLAAIGSGLMAGIFFIFSNTVMHSLAQLESSAGVASMQAINRVILNPMFFILFMGTAVLSLILPVTMLVQGGQAGVWFIVAGSLFYLLGDMLVTILFNVPMNNDLDRVSATGQEAATLWQTYLSRWTWWNHVRTVSALLAMVMFILGLN